METLAVDWSNDRIVESSNISYIQLSTCNIPSILVGLSCECRPSNNLYMSKYRLAYISILVLTSCSGIATDELPDAAIRSAAQLALPRTVRTIKVPHMAPFRGGQAISPHVIVDYSADDENFPGWTSPIQIENGSVIVGCRAWVRRIAGSMRLVLGVNSQVVGQNPPSGGVTPVALSAPMAPHMAVQILSISGQMIPVFSGTTYHLSVESVAQQGTSGVAQLLGLEIDISDELSPQVD